MRKVYSKLQKLCAKDPVEAEAVERLNLSAMRYLEQQDKAFNMGPQERMSAFFAVPGMAQAEQYMLVSPNGAPRTILDQEQKVQTVEPRLRQQSIMRLQILIFFGLAVHISITLFLANFFAKYISQRLENVLKNTLKLGARLPLDPPLRGTDEIADLDHALHKSASEILDFEKFKEQLVGMVSHELRTPLTSVQGTLTLLEAGALGEFPAKSLLEIEKAQASVKHLIALINNLLLLERIEAGSQVMKNEDLNIGEMIENSLEKLDKIAESKNVEIQCSVEELETSGDFEKLLQALFILVETSLRRAPPDSIFIITAQFEGTTIEIKLIDEGPALSTPRAANYFDRNRESDTSDEEDKGRILFLALSNAIIGAHSGSVAVTTEGPQTIFTIRLPAKRSPG